MGQWRKYCMKYLIFLLLVVSSQTSVASEISRINHVLDNLHQSASKADGKTYFSLFSENAVFIGTDPKETWKIKQFKAFALPYFEKGTGWTYHPRNRHIYFSKSGETAWFDEMLDNDKYGETRGTGVLVKTEQGWKIAQYHLTLPIPNDLTGQVVKLINKKINFN